MERKIFYGEVQPADFAQALLAEFNRGNLRAQILGQGDNLVVQVGTRPGAQSGGETAISVSLRKVEDDGVMVELGQQAWLGVAASLGVSALAALRNPFSLLGRLDDLAQDIENLQLSERIWGVITRFARSAGVATELSERLKRVTCEYCRTANPVGAPACVACGAPLGEAQPVACRHCGYVARAGDKICSNCGRAL